MNTVITMHLIALHEVLVQTICVAAAKQPNILVQIPAHVFIHDRKQEEELPVDTFLFMQT